MHAGGWGLRLNDGFGIKLSVKLVGAWWSAFDRANRGSTVGRLLLQCFRVGLLLRTRLVSSHWWILIYMFAALIHWRVEVLHADRSSMCIWTAAEPRVRFLQRKTCLSPQVIYYWPFQGDASVVVYSNCQCSSAFCLSLTYCSIYLADILVAICWKELSHWLFTCAVFILVPF